MRKWHPIGLGLFLLGLACGGLDDDHEAAKEPVASVVQFKDTEDPVAAYLQSCAAQQTTYDDMSGEPVPSCAWIEFDQMCAPDPSGCYDKVEGCKETCGEPCTTCESACATSCSTCKESCGDDSDCLRACATARAACQERCLSGREQCFSGCGELATQCYGDFEEKVARLCPQCSEYQSCVYETWNGNGSAEACADKHFPNEERCVGWCQPGI